MKEYPPRKKSKGDENSADNSSSVDMEKCASDDFDDDTDEEESRFDRRPGAGGAREADTSNIYIYIYIYLSI